MQTATAQSIGGLPTNAKGADEGYSANAQIEKKRSGFEMALRIRNNDIRFLFIMNRGKEFFRNCLKFQNGEDKILPKASRKVERLYDVSMRRMSHGADCRLR